MSASGADNSQVGHNCEVVIFVGVQHAQCHNHTLCGCDHDTIADDRHGEIEHIDLRCIRRSLRCRCADADRILIDPVRSEDRRKIAPPGELLPAEPLD
jgi:hypothetical protein